MGKFFSAGLTRQERSFTSGRRLEAVNWAVYWSCDLVTFGGKSGSQASAHRMTDPPSPANPHRPKSRLSIFPRYRRDVIVSTLSSHAPPPSATATLVCHGQRIILTSLDTADCTSSSPMLRSPVSIPSGASGRARG
ncbi:uncharacterized protein BP01DRAFT_122232 [Aspergillus saccharolyticus JOP 1030-1]|uniref:Uncharacterized protein n=1 Tax=Aspergillus saccharolyticus JOP 1030-1 TaxID=1450539 RepID=A0A318Z757_9EURO|nr:hypothetical protein BP01DRAFT_122232 [Aspergillus saccharolyticus JOP 1030-1]PYH42976.1 hypothetical protein BP01DRAFT_122232 [Aspergillus saccharolyticus JOP 1030-1]